MLLASVAARAAPRDVNILYEGQSNAGYFGMNGGMAALAAGVSAALGLEGTSSHVTILGGPTTSIWFATGMIFNPWLKTQDPWLLGNARDGWLDGHPEAAFITYLRGLPAAVKRAPTMILWLHNESDMLNPDAGPAAWESAIRFNIAEARAALGQGAATTPVGFVFVPFDFNPGTIEQAGAARRVQEMKAVYEKLARDPAFNAVVAAQMGDSDMSGPPGTVNPYGMLHVAQADIDQLARRLVPAVAYQLGAYARVRARVGARVGARTAVDWTGPEVSEAVISGPRQLTVSFRFAPGAAGLRGLSAAAAEGAGWAVVDGARVLRATAARLAGEKLVLAFSSDLPAGVPLHYGYGTGRIFAEGRLPGAGIGAAVYDGAGLPVWTPAAGVEVKAFFFEKKKQKTFAP